MYARTPDLDVVYVPWDGVDSDDAVRIGAAWLQQQPGAPLVLLHAKSMYGNNSLLPLLTAGATVEKPSTVWRSGWRGGPVLAPWPTEEVLAALSDTLAPRITAVCIIEWGDYAYQEAWLAAHGAIDLSTGQERGSSRQLLNRVVEVAMRQLSDAVNHNNGLVQAYDKTYAVRTLQELVRGGYRYEVEALCAWALANGFTHREVEHLRDYATRVLQGRSFRLRTSVGPRPGSYSQWEQEAHNGATWR
jgi:hypothetical protein